MDRIQKPSNPKCSDVTLSLMLNNTVIKAWHSDVPKHLSAGPVSGTPVALCTCLTAVTEKLPHAHGESFAVCTCWTSPADSGKQVQEVQSSSFKTELLYLFIVVPGNIMNFIEIWLCTESWSHSLSISIDSPTATLCQAALKLTYVFFNVRLQYVFRICSIEE